MTERQQIVALWVAIAVGSFALSVVVCLAETGTSQFSSPGGAPAPSSRPPNPALAPPSEQVPLPKRIFDPSLSTGKPEDCVDGTIWSPSLRGCMPPWHVEPPAK